MKGQDAIIVQRQPHLQTQTQLQPARDWTTL